MTGAGVDLAEAQAALRSGAFQRALDDFQGHLARHPDPAAYEGLAQAAWWLDDGGPCLEARENAYRGYRSRGEDRAAAGAAVALAYDSLLFGRGLSIARGWWGRARDLLAGLEPGPEHGWLAVREAELAMAADHDVETARSAGERASALGRRLGLADLEFAGMALSGLAMTSAGDAREGMSRLDTAAAAATSGDVEDLMWMGKICCWLIIACQETHDLGRADEWCQRVEAICERRSLTTLLHVCRIQHSSILVSRGDWVEAESTLVSVLDRFAGSTRQPRVEAVVQLGELRRRQGRLAEADELLRQAEFHPTAVAGRALIRLAQGDPAAAWSAIRALLRSIPVANQLARARILLPAVVTAHAAGDGAAADAAAAELHRVAARVDTDPLWGLATVAAATLAAASVSRQDEAADLWRQAVRRFHDSGLRLDEAESRLRLAASLLACGERVAAAEQVATATPVLAESGATALLEEAAALAGEAAARPQAGAAGPHAGPAGPLTPREAEVLRLVATGLSNCQIAATLVLSEHTVHRHVANILTKLGQPSRTGATAYAMTNGLL
ncbi:MAG TPA: helix-turn-helix transcriptional regulator [Dermatophilaceae bacterium]|nr:helix-turn-helix transcriptional regulator [Dermatophilaceae bacterium]